MKFTSEDLLKAMGLKVGDIVKLDIFNEECKIVRDRNGELILKEQNKTFNDTWIISNLMDCEVTIIPPKPKLTEDEKVILRNVPEKYKWIARDKLKDELFVYENKPIRLTECFEMTAYCERICAFKHLFQCIKWEDEPYSIEELLKEN